MKLSVENVCGLLIGSKLLGADDAQALYRRWQVEAKDKVSEASSFLRWLIGSQILTEYQANLVAKGHTEGYFIDQYKILGRVGKGRMAGVYKAVHQLGQVVAIKVLPPSRAKDPQMLARFQREAKLALRLQHANVVRSFQIGEYCGLHFLVMEHLEGETLQSVLQRRDRLPAKEAIRLIFQALEGLQHIHLQGLVHRDLKPANLMLVAQAAKNEPDTTCNALLKILDIGLGRELWDDGAKPDEGLTSEGALLGTPDYLAPEQARDPRSIDIRADIYSLGCVLYHMFTGQPPFPDKSALNQMIRHATEPPKPLKELVPGVPDALQKVVSAMLAKDPNQRFSAPQRAAQALQPFLNDAPGRPAADDSPQLKKYLTWLEKEPGARVPPSSPTDVPIARPALQDQLPATAPPTAIAEVAVKKPVTEPVTKKTEIDVELISTPVAQVHTGLLPLSNRDWLFMGVGAFFVIAAATIGCTLAWVFGP
jgi:serine/threonine protein kinase